MKKKIVISGAAGRMGSTIAKKLFQDEEVAVIAGLEHLDSDYLGKDLSELVGLPKCGIWIQNGLQNVGLYDVLIDFSHPSSTMMHLQKCIENGAAMVIGTTGLDEAQVEQIQLAAEHIPVLFAANTSIGVTSCISLVQQAAQSLGKIMDIEIIESHHRYKVDAPSGTALLLGNAVAGELGLKLPEDGVFERYGEVGAREKGKIGFSTIRGGDIVGEHTVMFIGDGERIEITHKATDRAIFAHGAVIAAKWICGKEAGLYDMRDVLGIKKAE